jgi:UDP-3-O-[3-hydroxymyristoyl] N-acetylglucosamine deacetylase
MQQNTLKAAIRIPGIGLHSGKPVRLAVLPAPAGHGIRFRRKDIVDRDPMVPALWTSIVAARLNTTLRNAAGVEVATVEHLMAALAGMGVHNALVELDGPELPIADGSAARFVRAIRTVGLRRLEAPLTILRVLRPIEVSAGDARAWLMPSDRFEVDFRIDFADAAIGRQALRLDMGGAAFGRELADSRTFCRLSEVEAMRANGLALGGNYENAIVVDGARVLSPGGLRHRDEFVRHKMLDAVGDLALAGAPILGRYVGIRAGHALTGQLVAALMTAPGAMARETADAALATRLPGPAPAPVGAARVA